MERIVIQISTLNKELWTLVFRFIEKCNGQEPYSRELFDDLKRHSVIVVDETPRNEDVTSIEGLRELQYDDMAIRKEYVFSIIYKKNDESEDFSSLTHFFLLKKRYGERLTLGIDVSVFSKQKQQNNYIFQCSIFLYFIKDKKPALGHHSIYFINERNANNSVVNKVSALRYKNNNKTQTIRFENASPYIFPMLPVDKGNFGIFDGVSPLKDDRIELYIDNSIKNIYKRLGLKQVNLNGCSTLFEKWFVLSFYAVALEKESVSAGTKELLLEYCHNIFELVQNIIFHTQEHRGLLYVIFNKKDKVQSSLRKKIPDFSHYDSDSRFLEYSIYDYGDKGVVKTFIETHESDPEVKTITLDDFFAPHKKVLEPLSKHLGIKSFVKSIVDHSGCFRVESNVSVDSKEMIECSGDNLSSAKRIGMNVSGTHYDVVMPVTYRKASFGAIQYGSIFKYLKDKVEKHSYIYEITSHALDLLTEPTSDKNSQEKAVSRAAQKLLVDIQSIFDSVDINNVPLYAYGVAINMETASVRPNMLYKIIDILPEINRKLNVIDNNRVNDFKIVFTNLSNEIIRNICATFDTDIDFRSNVSSPRFPIILMGKQWQIQMLYGSKRAELIHVNHRIHASYFSDDYFSKVKINHSEQLITQKELEAAEKLILPYDVLIYDLEKGETLFSSLINRTLDTPINNDQGKIGCKLCTPTKIGSKLYVEHYYEADFLFQNNFFIDRFAFFIAKEIVEKIKKKSKGFERQLVLVGYNPYASPLSGRVRDYVNHVFPNKIIDVVIAKEREGTKGLDFKMSEFLRKRLLENNNECGFITIVPIASTLSTNDKIISQFNMLFTKSKLPQFVYNHVTILVRDQIKDTCTEKEKARKWERIDYHTILTLYQRDNTINIGMSVDFLIQKEGRWHNLIDEDTFPKKWHDEIYINQTKNASLNTKDLLGYPISAMPTLSEMREELQLSVEKDDLSIIDDFFQISVKKLREMQRFIRVGHIIHDRSHHRYYFDIEQLFYAFKRSMEPTIAQVVSSPPQTQLELSMKMSNRREPPFTYLKKWLSYVKAKVDKEVMNVIITPDYDYESCFVDTINKEIFCDNAVVIYLNITAPRQNSIQKLAYLMNTAAPENAQFYFVDQALLTGDSYQKSKSHVASILNKYDFEYDGIITVINRLSKNKYDEIRNGLKTKKYNKKQLFSYLNLFVLPSQEPEKGCYLCGLHDLYKNLKRFSTIKDCRSEVERNKNKFETKLYSHYLKEESIDKNKPITVQYNLQTRAWLRLLWMHRLSFEIAKFTINNVPEKADLFSTLKDLYYDNGKFSEKKQVVDNKISFLKAISFPPLSQYVLIREFAHMIQLNELRNVLEKEDPDLNDLRVMLVLLKHLAILGSNALVRRDVIVKSWHLYANVRAKAPKDKLTKRGEFVSRFLFFIKTAAYRDEAKSFWIGELLRTGNEIEASQFKTNTHASKTILFNSIFYELKGHCRDFRKSFLPQLFYDNTAITRKTLDNFELALRKDTVLKNMFFDNYGLKSFEDICKNIKYIISSLKVKIASDYYYAWFRHYLDDQDKTADGIPILEKFSYVLYARLLLNDFMDYTKQKISSFDKNAEKLLEVATKILNAKAAFISIKTNDNINPFMTLARYNLSDAVKENDNLFCYKLLLDSTVGNGSPFVMKLDVSDVGESELGQYSRATFLMLNMLKKDSAEKDSAEKDICVGDVTFLYPLEEGALTEQSSSEDFFRVNAQESGRLLLLLKPELDRYVKHIADEKQFEVWKEKIEKQTRFEKVYSNSNHIFRSVFDQMAEFETIKYDILEMRSPSQDEIENMIVLSFSQTWYWLTNEMISYLYANIERHHNNGKHYLSLDKEENRGFYLNHSTRELFSSIFIKMLRSMLSIRWSGQKIVVNGVDISDEEACCRIDVPEANIHCNKYIMQTFIVQCLNNSLRSATEMGGHRICDSKKAIIDIDKYSITIRDEVIKGDITDKKAIHSFDNKAQKIKDMNCSHYSCTTLTSLQGFIYYMRQIEGIDVYDCSFGYKDGNFEVKIKFN